MKYENYCDICGKGILEEEIYHIEGNIGHLECFQKAITEYIILKDKIKRRNKQIKYLKNEIKRIAGQLYIYETYTDQIEFTEEDIKKLDELSTIK